MPIKIRIRTGSKVDKPNIVIIYTDDQGYGDLGCFGATGFSTPRIDKMAGEGVRLTSFYAAPVCTPSRASLMTGCYPIRIGLEAGTGFGVLWAGDPKGLDPREISMPRMLKEAGYATGMFGKWHLGDQPDFLPTRHGFDEFWGTPYSNDMWHKHPKNAEFHFPPLPLLEGESVAEIDPDQFHLTRRTTDRAVDFISRNRDRPFFCYVPFNMPHRPVHASETFLSRFGIHKPKTREMDELYQAHGAMDVMYPACMEEIDFSVGRILDAIASSGIDDNTFVMFASDNGPSAGSAGSLRGKKGSTWEGGIRVPCVMRWPGHIPSGRSIDAVTSTMDVLPTVANVVGAKLSDSRTIDGKNLWPVLSGEAASGEARDSFFYYAAANLRGVRSGPWKLHMPQGGEEAAGPLLYRLDNDIGETTDLSGDYPQIVDRLARLLDVARRELGDGTFRGSGARGPGRVDRPRTLVPAEGE